MGSIRYEIKTGYKHTDEDSKPLMESMKVSLMGVRCPNGHTTTTHVRLVNGPHNIVITQIQACCTDFEQLINTKLGLGREWPFDD